MILIFLSKKDLSLPAMARQGESLLCALQNFPFFLCFLSCLLPSSAETERCQFDTSGLFLKPGNGIYPVSSSWVFSVLHLHLSLLFAGKSLTFPISF